MASQSKAASHDGNRLRLCLLCRKKRKGLIKLPLRISEKLKVLVNFNPEDLRFPAAICISYKNTFYVALKAEDNKKICSMMPDYEEFTYRTLRLTTKKICDCSLCILVRGDYNFNNNKSSSSMSKTSKAKNEVLQESRKEKSDSVYNNVKTIIKQELTSKEREHLMCELIKDTKESKSVGAEKNTGELSLSQRRGRPLRIAVNTRSSKRLQISANDVHKIQTNYSMSANVILGVASGFRVGMKSRKIFEKDLKRKLTDLNHTLDEYFDIHQEEFVHVKGNKTNVCKQPFIFCKDVNDLCHLAQHKRDYEQVHLKFGIDGGGGFLKITLSVQNILEDAREPQRQFYRDGIAAKRFKDSGVKKIFLVGIAPHTQENYENVAKLWLLLKIGKMKGSVATDLKLGNILAGLMPHSSLHPCTWCNAVKGKLEQCGEYRTIGGCIKNYNDWKNAGGIKGRAKDYSNCTNRPVFVGKDEDEIIDFLPPPELHLILGVVNKLYDHMLQECADDALKWAKLCHVERQITHGRPGFAGNACNSLLKKIDVLRSFCSIGCLKYVQCLNDFQQVVKSCFSSALLENYKDHINKFQRTYLDLKISITPKVHAVFFHVAYFCGKTNKGLAFFSEQAVEATHHDFNLTWKKYQVSEEHPQYASKLLKAVCEYNSRHV